VTIALSLPWVLRIEGGLDDEDVLGCMTRSSVVLVSLDALSGIGQLVLLEVSEVWESYEAWLPSVLLGNWRWIGFGGKRG
jgi:hypothetical protein